MFRHAEARSRGIKVIIAGAGGTLFGMVAAKATLPVIGGLQSNHIARVAWILFIRLFRCRVVCLLRQCWWSRCDQCGPLYLRLLSVEGQAVATALANFAEEQEKSQRSRRMSSSKTIRNYRWRWSAGSDDGYFCYLHGTQRLSLDLMRAENVSRGGNHHGSYNNEMCGRPSSVGRSLRCSAADLKIADADGLDAYLSKKANSTRDRPASHPPKNRIFEGLSFHKAQVTVAPLQRSWPQAELIQISTCRKIMNVLKTTEWLRWPWSRSFVSRRRFGRSLCASWLGRLCLGRIR